MGTVFEKTFTTVLETKVALYDFKVRCQNFYTHALIIERKVERCLLKEG